MNDPVLRSEFEDRLDSFKVALHSEILRANEHQDEQFNAGFVNLRTTVETGFDTIRDDLRNNLKNYVPMDVFNARISPVQAIAYGLVGLLMALMSGLLTLAMWKGSGGH
ncbi:MAG: hypothetical protein EPO09_21825 [Aquabacterium sp.]|uniref:hypothetical protein n=1 Tax=Aquabacterium sp. TaxID=1872578 RepID=UPI001219C59B|nr:hypothetical protein [Aquabacterium sp.]TAK81829.1 MAG: hypothetical protein EPO09_21825 [Aquabacterium sp.]